MSDPNDPDLAVVLPSRERETMPPPEPSDTEKAPPPSDQLTHQRVAELLEIVKGIDERHQRFERNWHEAEDKRSAREQKRIADAAQFEKQTTRELRRINERLQDGDERMDGFDERFGEVAERDTQKTRAIHELRDEVTAVRLSLGPDAAEPLPLLVLIVEDFPELREVMARRLERNGMTVIQAQTLAEAENALRSCPDVVVIDILLEGESGMPLVRRIRSEHPTVGVLIFTGDELGRYRAEAEALGVAVIRKSVGMPALIDAIKAARVRK